MIIRQVKVARLYVIHLVEVSILKWCPGCTDLPDTQMLVHIHQHSAYACVLAYEGMADPEGASCKAPGGCDSRSAAADTSGTTLLVDIRGTGTATQLRRHKSILPWAQIPRVVVVITSWLRYESPFVFA